MKILITGGAGFITSHLAEAELHCGNKVKSLDIAGPEKIKHLFRETGFEYVQGDMLDPVLMDKLIKWADLIYHFGAIANVQIYCNDPVRVLDTNVGGIKLACELVHKYGKKLVFSSSSEIFGKNPKVPWAEDDDSVVGSTSRHRWCYSHTKIIGEHYCYGYASRGMRMAICRFFNFYGPRLDDIGQGRVITCFLEQFLKNEPVKIVEPGTQTRCFTYISDGIDGIMKVAHSPEAKGRAFNIGVDIETSMIGLYHAMREVGNFSSGYIKVPPQNIFGERYDDILRRIPNTTRLKSLGWEPKVSLSEGLKPTIDFFKEKFAKS